MGIYRATGAGSFDPIADSGTISGSVIPSGGVYALARDEAGEVVGRSLSGDYSATATLVTGNWVKVGSEYHYTVEDANVQPYTTLVHAFSTSDTEATAAIKQQDNMITGEGFFTIRAPEIPWEDINIGYTIAPVADFGGLFFFNYTGNCTLVESTNPVTGTKRGYIRLLSDGVFKCLSDGVLDLFGVGAGGGSGTASYTGGGGGGYTDNVFGVSVKVSDELSVAIGICPNASSRGGSTIITLKDAALLNAEGGYPGSASRGGNGGSGGGGSSGASGGTGGNGGSNGGNGAAGQASHDASPSGGTGQGFTTRPFLGDVSPFSDTTSFLLGPGGGGVGVHYSANGGIYGGGSSKSTGNNGTANTGGGGGKGPVGASGGSGTAFIRWGDWSS